MSFRYYLRHLSSDRKKSVGWMKKLHIFNCVWGITKKNRLSDAFCHLVLFPLGDSSIFSARFRLRLFISAFVLHFKIFQFIIAAAYWFPLSVFCSLATTLQSTMCSYKFRLALSAGFISSNCRWWPMDLGSFGPAVRTVWCLGCVWSAASAWTSQTCHHTIIWVASKNL